MKKSTIIVLMICVALLIAIDVKVILNLNMVKNNLEEEVDLLQSQINDLKNGETQKTEEEEDEVETESGDETVFVVPEGEISKDKFKVCSNYDTVYYENDGEEEYDFAKYMGIEVTIENGKAYLIIDGTNENAQALTDGEQVTSVKDKEITGFSAKPVSVYGGEFGQDIVGLTMLFLMDDGTVEYIQVADMLTDESYVSQGTIEGLTNAKQFAILSVGDTEGGGYITTIAIDKDGYYYDLSQMIYDTETE